MKKYLALFSFIFTFTFGSDSTDTSKIYSSDTSRTLETYNNGNISSISYHKDTENGLELIKQEVFHFTGGKSMTGTFENGLREGIWTFYYENGIKRLEGTYRSGKKIVCGHTGMITELLQQSISMIIKHLMVK